MWPLDTNQSYNVFFIRMANAVSISGCAVLYIIIKELWRDAIMQACTL